MDLPLARRLAALVACTYQADPVAAASALGADRAELFRTRRFLGLVVSGAGGVCIAFRGTRLDVASRDSFLGSLGAWIANLDFVQTQVGNVRVHRGWHAEYCAAEAEILALARASGAGERPLWLAGHSAGGALAILAAPALVAAGIPVRGVLSIAAPRVGDRAFAASYPVPVLRLERRHDPIPHLPLPPSLARVLGLGGLDPLIAAFGRLRKATIDYRVGGTEYVHVGSLWYDDGRSLLLRLGDVSAADYGRRLKAELAADLLKRNVPALPPAPEHPPWLTPVPGIVMDAIRLPTTAAAILRQVRTGRRDFLLDHHIDAGAIGLDRAAAASGLPVPSLWSART